MPTVTRSKGKWGKTQQRQQKNTRKINKLKKKL